MTVSTCWFGRCRCHLECQHLYACFRFGRWRCHLARKGVGGATLHGCVTTSMLALLRYSGLGNVTASVTTSVTARVSTSLAVTASHSVGITASHPRRGGCEATTASPQLPRTRRALAHEYDYDDKVTIGWPYDDEVTIAGAYNEVTIRHIRTARHKHSPPHTLHKHTAPYTSTWPWTSIWRLCAR